MKSKTLSVFRKQHEKRNCDVSPCGTENPTKNDPRKIRLTTKNQYLFRCNCGALEWVIVDDLASLTNLKIALNIGEQK